MARRRGRGGRRFRAAFKLGRLDHRQQCGHGQQRTDGQRLQLLPIFVTPDGTHFFARLLDRSHFLPIRPRARLFYTSPKEV